ncbi:MAG: MBL fold metallo-hydrolase [Candidatus Humimicrobiaceae bacterium]
MASKTKITFYGHSMFVVESEKGLKIGMDPYDEKVKSKLPDVSADIVTVSHSHFDHSNIKLFKGNPEIIKEAGIFKVKGITFTGYSSFHDNNKGYLRGKNIIFKFEIDEIVFAHLGDFGSFSDAKILNELKNTDILFIPVGGVFTINSKEALNLIKELKPKIAIPMHFKEKDTFVDVDEINYFKNSLQDFMIAKEVDNGFEITKEELPGSTEIRIIYSFLKSNPFV